MPTLPPELQEQLQALPPEVHAMLDALPPETAARPDPAPLLRYLTAVGLVTEQRDGPDDDNPTLFCHELVRERSRARMDAHPDDCAGLSENSIRLAYAGRLAAAFEALQHQDMAAALEAGSRAVVYCVQAGAYERLGDFASGVVTSTGDPRLLEALLPHLQAAAEAAPAGKQRWPCLCYLADALKRGGRPDASLPFYEQAAAQARNAAEAAPADSSDAAKPGRMSAGSPATGRTHSRWSAISMPRASGRLKSAEAMKKAGSPAVTYHWQRTGSVAHRHHAGTGRAGLAAGGSAAGAVGSLVATAPLRPVCAGSTRSRIPCPRIHRRARHRQGCALCPEDWQAALPRIEAILEVKRALHRPAEDIAATRMNRANVLKNAGTLRRGAGRIGGLPASLRARSRQTSQGAQFPRLPVLQTRRRSAGHHPGAPRPRPMRNVARSQRPCHLAQQPGYLPRP